MSGDGDARDGINGTQHPALSPGLSGPSVKPAPGHGVPLICPRQLGQRGKPISGALEECRQRLRWRWVRWPSTRPPSSLLPILHPPHWALSGSLPPALKPPWLPTCLGPRFSRIGFRPPVRCTFHTPPHGSLQIPLCLGSEISHCPLPALPTLTC